jgi:hypothetical protein
VPGFGRFKHAFTAGVEEFFSAKYVCGGVGVGVVVCV